MRAIGTLIVNDDIPAVNGIFGKPASYRWRLAFTVRAKPNDWNEKFVAQMRPSQPCS
jgi:hypothetical protein